MAADTPAKRLSAKNISSPWRGVSYPSGGDAGQRAAGIFLYSGITGATPAAYAGGHGGTVLIFNMYGETWRN